MKKLLMIITILVVGIFGAGGVMAGEDSSCHFHGNKVATEEIAIKVVKKSPRRTSVILISDGKS